jgi:hypothetical protein
MYMNVNTNMDVNMDMHDNMYEGKCHECWYTTLQLGGTYMPERQRTTQCHGMLLLLHRKRHEPQVVRVGHISMPDRPQYMQCCCYYCC